MSVQASNRVLRDVRTVISRLRSAVRAGPARPPARHRPRRQPLPARRRDRYCRPPGRGAGRGPRNSRDGGRAARRRAPRPRRARARRRTGGTGRGSMAMPTGAFPILPPTALAVARMPPSPTPRSTSGTPALAASAAHCRHDAAGTDRLVKMRTSAVGGRAATTAPACRSAGSGSAARPADSGMDCRAVWPARSRARSITERVHAPRSPLPALRSTAPARSRACRAASSPASTAGGAAGSAAPAGAQQPASSSAAASRRTGGPLGSAVIGLHSTPVLSF